MQNAAVMCEYSKDEFTSGLVKLGVDSIDKLKRKLPDLRAEVSGRVCTCSESIMKELVCMCMVVGCRCFDRTGKFLAGSMYGVRVPCKMDCACRFHAEQLTVGRYMRCRPAALRLRQDLCHA